MRCPGVDPEMGFRSDSLQLVYRCAATFAEDRRRLTANGRSLSFQHRCGSAWRAINQHRDGSCHTGPLGFQKLPPATFNLRENPQRASGSHDSVFDSDMPGDSKTHILSSMSIAPASALAWDRL